MFKSKIDNDLKLSHEKNIKKRNVSEYEKNNLHESGEVVSGEKFDVISQQKIKKIKRKIVGKKILLNEFFNKNVFRSKGYPYTIVCPDSDKIISKAIKYVSKTSNEAGGVLVGFLKGNQVIINDFIAGKAMKERATTLTYTHETWTHIHAEIDKRDKDEVIVGWLHSHPGYGVFLSGYDMFIHENFFNHPMQNAVVIDHKNAEIGIFGWLNGKVSLLNKQLFKI